MAEEPLDLRPTVPTEIRFGVGRFAEAADVAAGLGRRAFLVTTRRSMEQLGVAAALLEGLGARGVTTEIFRDYRLGPTTDDVDRGAERARAFGSDLVVGLGGGSALDCAKAVAAVAGASVRATEYLHGRAAPTSGTLPVLAIPTTAGSGSETNRSCIVTDSASPFKDGIRSDRLFPRCAIVDPSLTCSLDRETTATTGFDILAHAIESFVSPRALADADVRALAAAEAVVRWLPVALSTPGHLEARTALSRAATSMGANLTTVGTCLPHRADKPVCAAHPNIAHGQCLALLYPAWARRGWRGRPDRFARLTSILAPKQTSARADAFPAAISEFLRRTGLDRSPAEFGISMEEVPTLVENVAGDTLVDPVPATRDELPSFFREALSGDVRGCS